MKILIISNGYPEPRDPQWGCFEKDQALALQSLGHEVSIMFFDRRFRKYWRRIGITKTADKGLKVYGMYYLPMRWLLLLSYTIYKYLLIRLYYLLYLRYEKEQGKPDVIYAHYLWNIAYSSLIRKKKHIPLVGIEHWSGLTKDVLSPQEIDLGRKAYSNLDCLLSVSSSLQSHIKRHFGKDSAIVYDMLGPEFVSTTFFPNKGRVFSFIAVGHLIKRKGFDLLLTAFGKSNLAKSGCEVIIVGDGPERANLQKQAELLGVSEAVKLVGRKTKEEIVRLFQESNVFVLSSRAETFGVVCIEALSQGLPNIATICGGPEEFINERNGILIPPEDVNAMSNAMVNIFKDNQMYNNKNIADDCKQRFAPQVIAEQLTNIFVEVVNYR